MAAKNPSAAHAMSSVGLMKAQSPWLRKDGVYLGVFLQNSVSRQTDCNNKLYT